MERQAIVRGVNQLIARVNAPEALFAFLTQYLHLPEAWPVTTNPIFTSGGVHLGNLDLSIMQFGRRAGAKARAKNGPVDDQPAAKLYGIAFDLAPYEYSLPELDARGILHTPPMPFYQVDDQGWQITTWTSVFLGGLIGDSTAQRLFFALSHRADKEMWERGSLPSSMNRRTGLPYIFNTIYRQGATFSIDYNPVWRAANIKNERTHTGLDVVGVYEVTIGARDLERAYACWKALLDPYPQIADHVWELPNNLHIHLVSNPTDELLGMIWQVASLNRAVQFLHRHALLGEETSTGVTIDAQKMQGLDVRLIQ